MNAKARRVHREPSIEAFELAELTQLRRRLLASVLIAGLIVAILGVLLAVLLKDQNRHTIQTVGIAAPVIAGLAIASRATNRDRLFEMLRARPALIYGIQLACGALLWVDGGWNSTFNLLSFLGIGLAAAVAGVNAAMACAVIAVACYILGLLMWGYTPAILDAAPYYDTEHVVWNSLGYLLGAAAISVPIEAVARFIVMLPERARSRAAEGNPSPLSVPARPVTVTRVSEAVGDLTAEQQQAARLIEQGVSDDWAAKQMNIRVSQLRQVLADIEQSAPGLLGQRLLTKDEHAALMLRAQGTPKKLIGKALGKGKTSGYNYIQNAQIKLGVHSDLELVEVARKRGLID